LNVDQLLERSVKAAAELCKAEHATIYMPDQAHKCILMTSSTEKPPPRTRLR
jgi:hypothetical protein